MEPLDLKSSVAAPSGTPENQEFTRLAIACGGTGGHFFPGLSTARYFQQHGGEVLLFLGGKNTASQAAIATAYRIKTVIVKSSPRPHNIPSTFKFLRDCGSGVLTARRELRRFRPDAMLGMGSFASATAAMAARSLHIPLFLHEGNARIGRTNRYLSRWARHLAISFPPVNATSCKCPFTCTGMPVRPELLAPQPSREEAIAELNRRYGTAFRPELPLLLIFGGSQGAAVFNRILPEALLSLNTTVMQVIHLAGKGKLEDVTQLYHAAPFPHLVIAEADDMGIFYSACDVIVCRAGASSIAEISLFGKYAFLIPYPYAAEHHQDDNAAVLESVGAAMVVNNDCFTRDKALDLIGSWLSRREEYAGLAANGRRIARPEAAPALIRLMREEIARRG
ncbi:MAG: UDP-N-acetylglucosamine--N-acetylmuramyl-(pentapeptide) pyrophosphoryl-undecaprenol N-acetylglucosamine transferase [Victivallales bacterium]|nr:UDP-N-acetylglucosamine--N-acetylmuramyl-(pentapeptide) pyrophosphoryl-undecaprenol N-acetylglucosamine transferase [Victivallales bacterium]